ncbi:MAG: hypothetical protein WC441_04805 [Patescibacteria group bacterium]
MSNIFDTITESSPPKKNVFDEVSVSPKRNVFDEVTKTEKKIPTIYEKYPELSKTDWDYDRPLLNAFPKIARPIVQPVLSFGTNLALGASRSELAFIEKIDKMADMSSDIGDQLHIPHIKKPEFLQKIATVLRSNVANQEQDVADVGGGGITGIAGNIAGSLPVSTAEWMGNVPYAAISSMAESHKKGTPVAGNEVLSGVKGGVKRFALSKALRGVSKVKGPILRRGAGGAVLGGMAAVEGGTPGEIATQATMGALLSSYGGKRTTPDMPENLKMLKSVEKIPKGGVKYTFYNPQYAKTQAESVKASADKYGYNVTVKTKGNSIIVQKRGKYANKKGFLDRPEEQIVTADSKRIIEAEPVMGTGGASEINSANQKLLQWSKVAKKVRKSEVEPAISELRRKQAAKGTSYLQSSLKRGGTEWDSIMRSKGGYKGRADVPEITPPNLTDTEWNGYAKKVLALYPKTSVKNQFDRSEIVDALDRLRNGKIPTNREFEQIEKVIGREVTEKIASNIISQRPFNPWDIPKLIIQVFKSPFALDVQTARQASSFMAREPVAYAKGVGVATKAYGSEQFFNDSMNKLKSNPNHEIAVKSGVNFLSRSPYSKNRAEWFQFGLGETLAKVGTKRGRVLNTISKPIRGYGKLMMASERSMVAGTDSILQGIWDKQAEKWSHAKNLSPATLEKHQANYADTLNAFMKLLRAKSPQGKEIQRLANYILFSPSMTFSRPYRIKALLANKGSRGYAAQLIATEVGKIHLISLLSQMAGNYWRSKYPDKEPPIDGDINIFSSDWGKTKSQNTRYDIGGGDAQFYRTVARLAAGTYLKSKEAINGKTQTKIGEYRVPAMSETLTSYGKGRETAAIGFARQLFSGKDFQGNKINKLEVIARGITPQIAQSIYDAMASDGLVQGLAAGAASAYSANVSTYPESSYKKITELKDKIAQQKYNRKWEDLNQFEQTNLKQKYKKDLEPLELQKKIEQSKYDKSYEFPSESTKRAGEKVESLLNSEYRQVFKDFGIDIGIERTIGRDWTLNDNRYQHYQELVATNLNNDSRLKIFVGKPEQTKKSLQNRTYLTSLIEQAKKRAGIKMIQESLSNPRKFYNPNAQRDVKTKRLSDIPN